MSKKASARHRLEEVFPDSFLTTRKPKKDEVVPLKTENAAADTRRLVTAKAHDSLQMIKAFQSKNFSCGGDLLRAVARPAQWAFQETSITTFIYSFDKYPWVPVAKSIEQKARDANAALDAIPINKETFKLELDEEVPEIWSEAIHDRKWACRYIVRFCVRKLLDKPTERLGVPQGKRVVFDGHYLEPGDLDLHGDSGDEVFCDICNVSTLCEHKEELLEKEHVLQAVPIEVRHGGRITLLFRQKNAIGEGDYVMPWLLEKLCPGEHCIVESTDTDMMWILLRYAATVGRNRQILWQFRPGLSWICAWHLRYPPGQCWCDIQHLLSEIQGWSCMKVLKNPLGCLTTAALAAGCDYTDPLDQVPHKHWLNAVLKFADKVGDVVDDNWTPDYASFKRLMRVACILRSTNGKVQDVHQANRQMVGKRYWATSCDLACRFAHMKFYLIMLVQTAREDGVLYEPQPCDFAMERIDKEQPLRRGNIRRIHDSSDRDEARLQAPFNTTIYGDWHTEGLIVVPKRVVARGRKRVEGIKQQLRVSLRSAAVERIFFVNYDPTAADADLVAGRTIASQLPAHLKIVCGGRHGDDDDNPSPAKRSRAAYSAFAAGGSGAARD